MLDPGAVRSLRPVYFFPVILNFVLGTAACGEKQLGDLPYADGGAAGEGGVGGNGSNGSAGGAAGAAGEGGAPEAEAGGAAGAPHSEPWEPPVVAWPDPDASEPFMLSETGLYKDIASGELAPDLMAFEPAYALWSDAAAKRRWVRLPAGSQIDTSDMNHWQMPIGTVFFKEFTRDGVRVETRAIARTGPERFDYWMGAFVWNEAGTDAVFRPDGEVNARGTAHDVPTSTQCGTCHNGEAGRALGFSALQLSGPETGLLHQLSDADRLSDPVGNDETFVAPGEPEVAKALGYLHANCGHCHNPDGSARPDTNMNLRLDLGQTSPESTNAYLTTLGVELQYFDDTELEYRVVPGVPEQSALVQRMSERGTDTQMPPFATELVDDAGIELVTHWIRSLAE